MEKRIYILYQYKKIYKFIYKKNVFFFYKFIIFLLFIYQLFAIKMNVEVKRSNFWENIKND